MGIHLLGGKGRRALTLLVNLRIWLEEVEFLPPNPSRSDIMFVYYHYLRSGCNFLGLDHSYCMLPAKVMNVVEGVREARDIPMRMTEISAASEFMVRLRLRLCGAPCTWEKISPDIHHS